MSVHWYIGASLRTRLCVCLSAQTPNTEGDRLPLDSYLLVLVSLCCVYLSVSLPLPKLPWRTEREKVNRTTERKAPDTTLSCYCGDASLPVDLWLV